MAAKLFIDGKRSGYAPEQCVETLTVGQLRKTLNALVEWGELSDDMPIYLCNDNGYTYGEINYGEINDYNSIFVGEEWESAESLNFVSIY